MTAWARVCVAGPTSSIDVGLPADLPIADFLDELVQRLAGPPEVTEDPPMWALSPLGREALAAHETLRDAGVDDGTWLVLRRGPAEDPAVLVDDTLDALTEVTDARHRSWSPRTAVVTAAVTATTATLIAAAGLVVGRGSAGPSAHLAAATAVVVAVGTVLAAVYAGRKHPANPLSAALCAMAVMCVGAAGWCAVPGVPGAASALLAAAAATVCAALTLRTTHLAPIAHLAVITTGSLGIVAAVAGLAGLDRPRLGALVVVVALLVVLAAPRLTIVLAKIPLPPVPSPGEPVDAVQAPLLPTIEAVDAISLRALPDVDALARRAEHAREYLAGLCLGASAAAAVAATAVGVEAPDWRFTVLAVGVGAALVLRGRSHTDLLQATGLIAGGIAAVLGFLCAATVSPLIVDGAAARPLSAAVAALAVAGIALVVGGWAVGHAFSPLQRRAAELAEYGLLVVLIPLLLWVLEVYRMIREAW